MSDVTETKKLLRRQMRSLRESTAPAQSADSEKIEAAVMGLAGWKAAQTVLLYCSLPGEISTSALLASGKRAVVPLVVGDDLILKEYDPACLAEGYKGIMEPTADTATVDASEIDFAIVPGVAFDSRCMRLGRGKGFYDRLLPQLRCPKAGLAFDWQIVDEIPLEPHDAPLDLVVTPSRKFGKINDIADQ